MTIKSFNAVRVASVEVKSEFGNNRGGCYSTRLIMQLEVVTTVFN